MEVQLSPEKQARLRDFAARTGRDPEQLVVEAVDRMLEYDARFIEESKKAAMRRVEANCWNMMKSCADRGHARILMRIRWTATAADDHANR